MIIKRHLDESTASAEGMRRNFWKIQAKHKKIEWNNTLSYISCWENFKIDVFECKSDISLSNNYVPDTTQQQQK